MENVAININSSVKFCAETSATCVSISCFDRRVYNPVVIDNNNSYCRRYYMHAAATQRSLWLWKDCITERCVGHGLEWNNLEQISVALKSTAMRNRVELICTSKVSNKYIIMRSKSNSYCRRRGPHQSASGVSSVTGDTPRG